MTKTSKPAGAGRPSAHGSKLPGGPSSHAVDAVHILSGLAELAGKFGLDDGNEADEAAPLPVGVTRLPHACGLPLPEYQTGQSAGMDLAAAVPESAPLTLAPGAFALVPTGLAMAIPPGFDGQIRPRSGLALRHGVTVLNSPGTIDADYRGEIGVILINHGPDAFTIRRGDRIAQLVFGVLARAELVEKATLGDSQRGAGGFGSTGTKSPPK